MADMVISFSPSGVVAALHNDGFDLAFLGPKKIRRQTDIVFNETSQLWDIHYLVWGEDDTCLKVRANTLDGFTSYERARVFEVEWVNKCRLHGVIPQSDVGLSYAQYLREGRHKECFTLANGECIGTKCMHLVVFKSEARTKEACCES